jgi:hypothetical protein
MIPGSMFRSDKFSPSSPLGAAGLVLVGLGGFWLVLIYQLGAQWSAYPQYHYHRPEEPEIRNPKSEIRNKFQPGQKGKWENQSGDFIAYHSECCAPQHKRTPGDENQAFFAVGLGFIEPAYA